MAAVMRRGECSRCHRTGPLWSLEGRRLCEVCHFRTAAEREGVSYDPSTNRFYLADGRRFDAEALEDASREVEARLLVERRGAPGEVLSSTRVRTPGYEWTPTGSGISVATKLGPGDALVLTLDPPVPVLRWDYEASVEVFHVRATPEAEAVHRRTGVTDGSGASHEVLRHVVRDSGSFLVSYRFTASAQALRDVRQAVQAVRSLNVPTLPVQDRREGPSEARGEASSPEGAREGSGSAESLERARTAHLGRIMYLACEWVLVSALLVVGPVWWWRLRRWVERRRPWKDEA